MFCPSDLTLNCDAHDRRDTETTLDYQSINSRNILIPELGLTLHLSSIEVPEAVGSVDLPTQRTWIIN